MTSPAEHAATVERVMVQGERAMAELGWTMANVSWRKSLAALAARADELEAALEAVGLPRESSVEGLIRHHRANAALAAGFDMVAAEARADELERERGEAHAKIERLTSRGIEDLRFSLERAEAALRAIRQRHLFLSDTASRDTYIDACAGLGEQP